MDGLRERCPRPARSTALMIIERSLNPTSLRGGWKRPSSHAHANGPLAKLIISARGVLSEVLALLVLTSPLLWGLALQLHSAVTGTYIPGTHSIALVTCLNEQIARDIARAIMDKKLAAYVNILPKSSALYFWKGELEESTEILLLVKTRTSKIGDLTNYIRSIHPFEMPDIISLPIDRGNPPYLRWIGENVPRD
ncbi:protein CutA homolog [Sylvia atricapilla]|uniref:protein CutA homolog n=1 Tax=Sylvia atricapilla TaxID=48155 RepID=UPI00339B17F4